MFYLSFYLDWAHLFKLPVPVDKSDHEERSPEDQVGHSDHQEHLTQIRIITDQKYWQSDESDHKERSPEDQVGHSDHQEHLTQIRIITDQK